MQVTIKQSTIKAVSLAMGKKDIQNTMKASGMNILTEDGRLVARLYITETVDSMEQFLAQERACIELAKRMAACDDMLAALDLIYANAAESPEWIRAQINKTIAKAKGTS